MNRAKKDVIGRIIALMLAIVLAALLMPATITAEESNVPAAAGSYDDYDNDDFIVDGYPRMASPSALSARFMPFGGSIGAYDWDELEDVITNAPVGEQLTVILQNDITATGNAITLPTGADIALTSAGGAAYTILQTIEGALHFEVGEAATLRLYNVTISGDRQNLPYVHGGIRVMTTWSPDAPIQRGHLIMEEGSAVINSSGWEGVIMVGHALFTMNGGVISNNISIRDTYDGFGVVGIHGAGALFTMNDGLITQNEGLFSGSVSLMGAEGHTNFIMNGGVISHNTGYLGGGVLAIGAIITMNGGRIEGNTSRSIGGGISLLMSGILTMNNGAYVSNNTAQGDSGLLYDLFDLDVTGGGGGVAVLFGSHLEMHGGEISGNNTPGYGGGVIVGGNGFEAPMVSASVTMFGGSVSGNTAMHGGGLHGGDVDLGNITILSPTVFSDNVAEAGMFVDDELAELYPQIAPGTVSTSWLGLDDAAQAYSAAPHAFTNYDVTATGERHWRVTYEAIGPGSVINFRAFDEQGGTPITSGMFVHERINIAFDADPLEDLVRWDLYEREAHRRAASGDEVELVSQTTDTVWTGQIDGLGVVANTHIVGTFSGGGNGDNATIEWVVTGGQYVGDTVIHSIQWPLGTAFTFTSASNFPSAQTVNDHADTFNWPNEFGYGFNEWGLAGWLHNGAAVNMSNFSINVTGDITFTTTWEQLLIVSHETLVEALSRTREDVPARLVVLNSFEAPPVTVDESTWTTLGGTTVVIPDYREITITGLTPSIVFTQTNAWTHMRLQNGRLTLTNITLAGDRHNLPANHHHGGIELSGGHLILDDGAHVINNRSWAGGITPHNDSILTMNPGSSVTGNYGSEGAGGVNVGAEGGPTFIMNGGTISYNEGIAGGVMVMGGESQPIFIMNGGVIRDNIGTAYGGGVGVINGTMTLNGGEIRNNFSEVIGGGIALLFFAELTMNGGVISGNYAAHNPIYVEDMDPLQVGDGAGAGVAVAWDSTFEMFGGTISGNFTPSKGGGVYVSGLGMPLDDDDDFGKNTTFVMHGGHITGNTAMHGGGLHATAETLANITIHPEATFSNNVAEAGMFVDNALAAANPQIAPGTVSVGWVEGMAGGVITAMPPHAFTNYDITATGPRFWRVTHVVGTGPGSVSAVAGANNLALVSGHFVPDGQNVTFSATPAAGFVNWAISERAPERLAADGSEVAYVAAGGGTAPQFARVIGTNTRVVGNFEEVPGATPTPTPYPNGNGNTPTPTPYPNGNGNTPTPTPGPNGNGNTPTPTPGPNGNGNTPTPTPAPNGGGTPGTTSSPRPTTTPVPANDDPTHDTPYAHHLLYIIGFPDGNFHPQNYITRAEIAGIVARIHFGDFPRGRHSADFPDITGREWFANYLGFAQQRQLVRGYPCGNYMPANHLTRAEFTALMARFVGHAPGGMSAFPDVGNHWATGYINTMYNAGMITGYPDGTFRPNHPITRAEAVTLVNRILGRGVDASGLASVHHRSFPDIAGHWAYYEIIEASNSHRFRLRYGREIWEYVWWDIWWLS